MLKQVLIGRPARRLAVLTLFFGALLVGASGEVKPVKKESASDPKKDTSFAELKRAVDQDPGNGYAWCSLAGAYGGQKDEQRALDAYIRAYEADRAQHTAKSFGWMPLSATIEAASILMNQMKYDEALQVLGRYDDSDMQKIAPAWGKQLLRLYGQIYAGLGREKEALEKFKAALELEKK
jgi:tetratricopeptide (TPR) repeat protein